MTAHVHAQATSEAAAVPVRVLQRACACGEGAGVSGECPACAAEERLGVQPKLAINRPGDRWEQEADRIADQVVSERPAALAGPLPVMPLVQRQEVDEEEDEEEALQAKRVVQRQAEEEDELLQAKSVGGAPTAPAIGRAAAVASGGGRPLSRAERAWFEPRLGRDLSHVRIHDDACAGAAARGIKARAYTLRNHIAFARGAYDPGAIEGRRLMAHELVHTLQQLGQRNRSIIRRQPSARCAALMRRPTPSNIATGQLVEREIIAHFEARYGPNQSVTLPDASFAPYRMGIRRFQPGQVFGGPMGSLLGSGRPDLALRSRGGQVMLLAEIKAANYSEFLSGESQLLNYINKGNSEENQLVRQALDIRAFSPMTRFGRRFATPRYVFFGRRRFRVMWCGPGVIVYKETTRSRRRRRREERRRQRQATRSQHQAARRGTTARTPRGPRASVGAYNFGFGLSILSGGGGAGNAGIGISILSEGVSIGTVSAGIAYNSQGVAVGTVGAGISKENEIAAALSAGAGTIESSSVAGLATAGIGEVEGVSGGTVATAGTGTIRDRSGTAAARTGAEAEAGESGATSARSEQTEASEPGAEAGGEGRREAKVRAPGPEARDPAAVEAALRAAAEADRAVQGATEAQRRFLETMISRGEGGLYVLPAPEWIARMLVATEGASEEELQYLATLTWRPGRSSAAELRQQVRHALEARRKGRSAEVSAAPTHPVEGRPPAERAGRRQASGAATPAESETLTAEERERRRLEHLQNLRDRARAFDLARHPEGSVVYKNPADDTLIGQRISGSLYFPKEGERGTVVAVCDVEGRHSGDIGNLTFEVLTAGPVVTAEGAVFEGTPLVGRRWRLAPPEWSP